MLRVEVHEVGVVAAIVEVEARLPRGPSHRRVDRALLGLSTEADRRKALLGVEARQLGAELQIPPLEAHRQPDPPEPRDPLQVLVSAAPLAALVVAANVVPRRREAEAVVAEEVRGALAAPVAVGELRQRETGAPAALAPENALLDELNHLAREGRLERVHHKTDRDPRHEAQARRERPRPPGVADFLKVELSGAREVLREEREHTLRRETSGRRFDLTSISGAIEMFPEDQPVVVPIQSITAHTPTLCTSTPTHILTGEQLTGI